MGKGKQLIILLLSIATVKAAPMGNPHRALARVAHIVAQQNLNPAAQYVLPPKNQRTTRSAPSLPRSRDPTAANTVAELLARHGIGPQAPAADSVVGSVVIGVGADGRYILGRPATTVDQVAPAALPAVPAPTVADSLPGLGAYANDFGFVDATLARHFAAIYLQGYIAATEAIRAEMSEALVNVAADAVAETAATVQAADAAAAELEIVTAAAAVEAAEPVVDLLEVDDPKTVEGYYAPAQGYYAPAQGYYAPGLYGAPVGYYGGGYGQTVAVPSHHFTYDELLSNYGRVLGYHL
eukprot:Selendium_serpulae@DN6094_c1_g1_i1.p1